jgi:hypothetical protein
MKKYIFIFINCLSACLLYAQKKAPVVDSRVDNQRYWKKMAELGLVKLNPVVPVPMAKNTGSAISSPAIALSNSTDVLIDNTNGSTQSENSVAINPGNKLKALNSNNSTKRVAGRPRIPPGGELQKAQLGIPAVLSNSVLGTSGFMTGNRGATWGGSIEGTGGENYGDPAAAIDNNNRYYVGCITSSGGQGVAYSTNEGVNWQQVTIADPVCINPFNCLLDKNHLTVDKSVASPFQNNVYSAWTDFGGADSFRIVLSRSVNGALNWSNGLNISGAAGGRIFHQGVNLQTGPNGEVYAVWASYDRWPVGETSIGFTSSVNGGVSFSAPQLAVDNILGIRTTNIGKNIRVNSFPSMTVDNSYGPGRGSIYVVWANVGTPGTNTGTDVDIYFIKSANRGANWSAPQRINQKVTGAGKKHFFPWITCDPVTGKLHVIYYDDRNVGTAQCETWMSSSYDGGTTWEDYKISDVAFSPTPIPDLAGGYFGDYLGISASDDVIYPVWTDNRTGIARAYTSPLISADACVPALNLQNITMPLPATFKYRASSTISTAGGGSNYVMQGNGSTGARSSMVAANSITLQPGTSIQTGAVLNIVTGPCASPLLRSSGNTSTEELISRSIASDADFGITSRFSIYPNPAQNNIVLRMPENMKTAGKLRYTIITLMGELMAQNVITENFQRIDIRNLKPGGYFVNVFQDNKLLETKRLVKE